MSISRINKALQYRLGWSWCEGPSVRFLSRHNRDKKWHWPLLVINAINISVVAARRVHCTLNANSLSHLEFLREVTLCLLKSSTQPLRQVEGVIAPNLPADLPVCNGGDYYKKSAPQGEYEVCQKNTLYRCSQCNVRFHCDKGSVCFELYYR